MCILVLSNSHRTVSSSLYLVTKNCRHDPSQNKHKERGLCGMQCYVQLRVERVKTQLFVFCKLSYFYMTNTVGLEPDSQMCILKCVLTIHHVLVVQLCYPKSPQKCYSISQRQE